MNAAYIGAVGKRKPVGRIAVRELAHRGGIGGLVGGEPVDQPGELRLRDAWKDGAIGGRQPGTQISGAFGHPLQNGGRGKAPTVAGELAEELLPFHVGEAPPIHPERRSTRLNSSHQGAPRMPASGWKKKNNTKIATR